MMRSIREKLKKVPLLPAALMLAAIAAISLFPYPSEERVALADRGNQFYVAINGSPNGDGSAQRPWNLETALAQPSTVRPGDTIWIAPGLYRGPFESALMGSAERPIVVRGMPGDGVAMEAPPEHPAVLTIRGADTWYRDFELFIRTHDRSIQRGKGLTVLGPRTKCINLVIHDTGGAVGFWEDAIDAELYGNIWYHNGIAGPRRGHGHGVYTQNRTGLKRIEDNIHFGGFGMGIRVVGSKKSAGRGYRIVGNIGVNSGVLYAGSKSHWDNFFVSVDSGSADIELTDNHSYHSTRNGIGYSRLGWVYSGREFDVIARNNYWVGGQNALEVWNWDKAVIQNNHFVTRDGFFAVVRKREEQSFADYAWDENDYYGQGFFYFQGKRMKWDQWRSASGFDDSSRISPHLPAEPWVNVRPNRYEAGRANIVIYNWPEQDFVDVDLEGLLDPNDGYEIRDALNFKARPVAEGVFSGRPVAIPMKNLEAAQAIGSAPYVHGKTPHPVTHPAPEFGVFVVRRTAGRIPNRIR